MKQLYEPTQLIKSEHYSALLGRNVFLKMDCSLPSGSFKIRGMSHLIQTCVLTGQYNRFIASSGGNAGIAAAYQQFLKRSRQTLINIID